jgi:RNA 3'-terminal phosphate cyclase (ATP)
MSMSKLIEIDGGLGEGGGQVLRTSLALALITGKAFRLRNIRAKRSRPGLQAQHLMSVKAAAQIGQARTRGACISSIDLTFEPGPVAPGKYHFKIGTAGATSLVLHTIYLPLALAGGESTVTIEGGTHVKASPCYDFLSRTWAPYLRTLGGHVGVKLERVGFYPRGGGMIHAHIRPIERLLPFAGMTTTAIKTATIVIGVAGLPAHVGDRLAQRATMLLRNLGLKMETRRETWTGGPGCMLGVELPTEPAPTFLFALGEKGKPAEAVADEAASQVDAFLNAQPLGVDEHSADQLLLPLALAQGTSQFRVAALSSHLLTNADIIGHFLERRIECEGEAGEPGVVRIS